MKKNVLILISTALVCSCTVKSPLPMGGMIDSCNIGVVPECVYQVADHPDDARYSCMLNDSINSLSVWELTRCAEDVSSEGYGLLVVKEGVASTFAKIRHGRNPRAFYDAEKGELWIIGSEMEGTGVNVERPYLLRFSPNGDAFLAASIAPYEVQEALVDKLGYSIDGNKVSIYHGNNRLCTVENTIMDYGAIHGVWVGEQLEYDISEDGLTVYVTPGVEYEDCDVPFYDDMPTFSSRVSLTEDGFTLSKIVKR